MFCLINLSIYDTDGTATRRSKGTLLKNHLQPSDHRPRAQGALLLFNFGVHCEFEVQCLYHSRLNRRTFCLTYSKRSVGARPGLLFYREFLAYYKSIFSRGFIVSIHLTHAPKIYMAIVPSKAALLKRTLEHSLCRTWCSPKNLWITLAAFRFRTMHLVPTAIPAIILISLLMSLQKLLKILTVSITDQPRVSFDRVLH